VLWSCMKTQEQRKSQANKIDQPYYRVKGPSMISTVPLVRVTTLDPPVAECARPWKRSFSAKREKVFSAAKELARRY